MAAPIVFWYGPELTVHRFVAIHHPAPCKPLCPVSGTYRTFHAIIVGFAALPVLVALIVQDAFWLPTIDLPRDVIQG
jgi:hypothetical protein